MWEFETTFHSLLTMSRSISPPGTPPHQGIPDPKKCPPAPRRRVSTMEHWLGRIPADSLDLREYFLSLSDPVGMKKLFRTKSADAPTEQKANRLKEEAGKVSAKE